VDFRPDQWHDPRAFGVVARLAFHTVDVVVGTEDELRAAAGATSIAVSHSQMSDARVEGDAERAIQLALERGARAVVLKRGVDGATVYTADGASVDADPFPVEVLNILGAGDAFASGLIYGYLQGWDWRRAARMANASGAIVVTRPACANSMPTLAEAEAFVAERGGL
jgi:5-dehydro-2-deoxygluconokinase